MPEDRATTSGHLMAEEIKCRLSGDNCSQQHQDKQKQQPFDRPKLAATKMIPQQWRSAKSDAKHPDFESSAVPSSSSSSSSSSLLLSLSHKCKQKILHQQTHKLRAPKAASAARALIFSLILFLTMFLFLAVPEASCESVGLKRSATESKLATAVQTVVTKKRHKRLLLGSQNEQSPSSGGGGGVNKPPSSQLGDWLVHSVAPVVATRLIDNVLEKQTGVQVKKVAKALADPIDTQALANKIVDHLADGLKKRRQGGKTADKSSTDQAAPSDQSNGEQQQINMISQNHQAEPVAASATSADKSSSRRGKSLVSDSVQQVMQNLLPLGHDAMSGAGASGSGGGIAGIGQRTFFGRAMQKHRQLTQGFSQHFASSQREPSRSSWTLVAPKEHQHQQHQQQQQQNNNVYNEHVSTQTDSSQLDENPVVFRAEHGHNLTTMTPPLSSSSSSSSLNQNREQQQLLSYQRQQQQQLMRQKQQLNNKYVHTNRHNQQQSLSPKPWQGSSSMMGLSGGNNNKRHHHQSPYSYPHGMGSSAPTSDINIVLAPSSPAPPSTTTQLPTTTTSAATTTTSTSTTALPPVVSSIHNYPASSQHHSLQPHAQVTQIERNKFKINNRHQFPSSSVAVSPNSWFSTNQPHHRFGQPHHRYPSAQQPSSTTSTTTTTTSTTTTTPEPAPPQTDYVMPPDMMDDLGNIQASPSGSSVNSLLSQAAQTALDALGASAASMMQSGSSSSSSSSYDSYGQPPYSVQNTTSNSLDREQQSTSSSSSNKNNGNSQTHGTKSSQAAPSSTTTARHSVITAEAIPTALGAPLYHLTRNFTTHSFLGAHQLAATPPRRNSLSALASSPSASPAAKALAQYFQKGVNNLSSTIFSRQSKGWARRLGLSSMVLSGLLYGAAVLSNPGAPLPTNGAEVIRALGKGIAVASTKKRRTFGADPASGLVSAEFAPNTDQFGDLTTAVGGDEQNIDRITGSQAALLDNNVIMLYQQQPQLMAIVENLLQQEQQALLQRQQQQLQRQDFVPNNSFNPNYNNLQQFKSNFS